MVARRLHCLVLLFVVVLFAGAVAGAATSATDKKLIGMSNPIATIPGQLAFIYGAREAAKQVGLRLKVLDANLSADKQITDIDLLATQGAAGIMSWTLDEGSAAAAYRRANKKGIFLVGFNSKSPYFNTVIKNDTDSSCRPMDDAAAYIAKRIPRAKTVVLGGPPVTSITHAMECFVTAAKKLGLVIVAKKDNVNDTSADGQRLASDVLTKDPDVQAIWSFDDVTGLGVSAALRAANKPIWSGTKKGVMVIGKDGDKVAITAIKKGIYTATYDENPMLGGAAASVALGEALVYGRKMPKTIRIPYRRYDSTNAGQFIDPLARKVRLDRTGLRGFAKRYGLVAIYR